MSRGLSLRVSVYNKTMDLVIIFLADYLIFILMGWAIVKNWRVAVVSLVLVWLISELIKNYFFVHRPFIENPLASYHSDGSFPSGHAASAFASAMVIYFKNRKSGFVAFTMAILVGLGRILGGVHTLVDVVGGMSLGLIGAALTTYHSKC